MSIVIASGFGTSVNVKASNTFPQGFDVTQFADDADSLDIPELVQADSGMGLNGHHVVWSKPAVMEVTLNVIPNSPDDLNLETLFDANRLAEQKQVANDVVTLSIAYPNGEVVVLAEAICLASTQAKGISQAGRMKTRAYRFRYTKLSRARAE